MAIPKSITTDKAPAKGSAAFDAAAAAARGPAPAESTALALPEDPAAQAAVVHVTLAELAAQSDGWDTAARIVQLKEVGDQFTGELLAERGSIKLNPEIDRRSGEVIEKPAVRTVLLRAGKFTGEIMATHEIERQIGPLYDRVNSGARLLVRITRGEERNIAGGHRVTDYVVQSKAIAPGQG